MRKNFITALVATAGIAFAAQANATVFVLDSIDVSHHGAGDGSGLEVEIVDLVDAAGGYTIDLGVDDPQYRPLFYIYSNESWVNPGEDTVAKPISVSFNFSSPGPNGSVDPIGGVTNGVNSLFGIFQYGTLTWLDPDGAGPLGAGESYFTWGQPGNQGLMKISLFNLPTNGFGAGPIHGPHTGTFVKAKFDWEIDPVAVVPEPGAWALMIGGFGLAGAGLRRRRALAAA